MNDEISILIECHSGKHAYMNGVIYSVPWRTDAREVPIGSVLRYQHRDGEFVEAIVIYDNPDIKRDRLPLDFRYHGIVSVPTAPDVFAGSTAVDKPKDRGELRSVAVKFCHSKYAESSFTHNKHYHYLWDGRALPAGTLVVVPVGGQTYPHMAVVVEDEQGDLSPTATKWIIEAIDMTEYNKRLELGKKREKLLKQMEARLANQSKIDRFKKAAADDPEMARLLEEYRTISA